MSPLERPNDTHTDSERTQDGKRAYAAPKLVYQGEFTELTLSGGNSIVDIATLRAPRQ